MTAQDYIDFELEIGPGLGREYPLAVIRSPGGEARGNLHFPFDELALESRLKDLQIALLLQKCHIININICDNSATDLCATEQNCITFESYTLSKRETRNVRTNRN